jgi:hypothetical protein
LGLVTGNENPRDASLAERSVPGVAITTNPYQ